jgi:hypothetical protein
MMRSDVLYTVQATATKYNNEGRCFLCNLFQEVISKKSYWVEFVVKKEPSHHSVMVKSRRLVSDGCQYGSYRKKDSVELVGKSVNC